MNSNGISVLLGTHIEMSALDRAFQLLGENEDISNCRKYQSLLEKHPCHTSFRKYYDISLAKVQVLISKKHNQLKRDLQLHPEHHQKILQKKKIAEKLMDYWNIYYY